MPLRICFCLCLLTAAGAAKPAERLPAAVHWIGNTLPGAAAWVPQDVEALHVTADGTVFTNIPWEEGGGNCTMIRDGKVLGHAGHTHGWGNGGGRAVAANARWLFIGTSMGNEGGGLKDPGTWPPKGRSWFGVSRRPRHAITEPAPFPGGKGGAGDTLKGSFLVVAEVPDNTSAPPHIPGLAASETELFISDPVSQEIVVRDADSMARKRAWKVPAPGPLQLDAAGRLWALHHVPETDGDRSARLARLTCFTTEGREVARLGFDDEGREPVAFAMHPDGRIFVANGSPGRGDIMVYRLRGKAWEILPSIGALRGIHDTTGGVPEGTVGHLRFHRPSAIGIDASGRLYVAHRGSSQTGSTVLECLTPDLSPGWRLAGLTFVDLLDADPADDTQLFTKEERFVWDPDAPPGSSWRYAAATWNPGRFPDDPRTAIWSAGAWVRRIAGRRFLFVTEMNGGPLQAYRFEDGSETAIPAALCNGGPLTTLPGDRRWPAAQPAAGAWLWRDADGDGSMQPAEFTSLPEPEPESHGWWVDDRGDLWRASLTKGIRQFPCAGLDARGVPQWSLDTIRTWPHPEGMDEVRRLRYLPDRDLMVLSGNRGDDRNQHWKPMGPVLACWESWKGQRRLRWQRVLPYVREAVGGHASQEPASFDVAGDFVFIVWSGRSDKLGHRWGHVDVHRLADGSLVGFMEPSEPIGEIGLQDLRESIRAWQRRDGSYAVAIEDDYKAKIVLYHWKPAPR